MSTMVTVAAVAALLKLLVDALNTAGTWETGYAMVTLVAAVGWTEKMLLKKIGSKIEDKTCDILAG